MPYLGPWELQTANSFACVSSRIKSTRKPYSFRGGERGHDGTWRWRDGLGVIGGDMVTKAMRENFQVPEEQLREFKSVGGLRRAIQAGSPLVQMFLMICQTQYPLTLDQLKEKVAALDTRPPTLARGREVGDLDRICAEGVCRSLQAAGSPAGITFDFDDAQLQFYRFQLSLPF